MVLGKQKRRNSEMSAILELGDINWGKVSFSLKATNGTRQFKSNDHIIKYILIVKYENREFITGNRHLDEFNQICTKLVELARHYVLTLDGVSDRFDIEFQPSNTRGVFKWRVTISYARDRDHTLVTIIPYDQIAMHKLRKSAAKKISQLLPF